MKILNLIEVKQTFEELFASAKTEMFKAEVLQDYTAVDDCASLRAWLVGDEAKANELGRADKNIIAWREQCLASPAKITRVHVVDELFTPYLKWETEVIYKGSLLPSGAEDVYFAPKEKLAGVHLPAGDFWIFDNSQVLQWEYEDGKGKLIGGKVWPAGDDIHYFLELKEKLLHNAKSLKTS